VVTIDDLIPIAERCIQQAQDGFGATSELEDAMTELEPGSELLDAADLMRAYVDDIEGAAAQLTQAVWDARAELRSWRRKAAA
jgi:hypothetical protein